MASYLPQITDYIPHLQPFHPDLNFYSNVLQIKEAQYQSGYKQLSGLYGTLLNSPMLRDPDIKRRDEFFKTIQQDIQKVSEADLSLEENVNSARTIFQPLLNDKNIISDMSYTKKYNDEMGYANTLRNCMKTKDNPCDGYWQEGVMNLNYWRDDYSQTNDQEALEFASPRYVPKVDIGNLFNSHIKGMGFKMTRATSDGSYIIENTNGEMMTPHLYQYMWGVVGQDPAVQDMYRVKASNIRHQWIDQNAPLYGGNRLAAEDAYDSQQQTTISRNIESLNKALHLTTGAVQSQIDARKKEIDNKQGIAPDSELMKSLAFLLQQRKGLQAGISTVQQASSQADPSGRFGASRQVNRYNLDSALGTLLIQRDLLGLSKSYANSTSESKMTADPYGVAYRNHQYNMEEIGYRNKLDMERDAQKIAAKLKQQKDLFGLDNNWSPDTSFSAMRGSSAELPDEYVYEKGRAQEYKDAVTQGQGEIVKSVYSGLTSLAKSSDTIKAKEAAGFLYTLFGVERTKVGTDLKSPERYYSKVSSRLDDRGFQSAFPTIVDYTAPHRAELDKTIGAVTDYDKRIRGNVKSLLNYLDTKGEALKDANKTDRVFMKSLFNDQGDKVLLTDFRAKWAPKFGGYDNFSLEDAKELYDKYYQKFATHYKSGYDQNGTPVVSPFTTQPGVAPGTGGLAAGAIAAHVDPYNINQAALDLVHLRKVLSTSSDYGIVKGLNMTSESKGAVVSPTTADPTGISALANAVLGQVAKEVQETLNGQVKKDKITSNIAVHEYPITLSDPNMQGIGIEVSKEFLDQLQKDNPKLRLDPNQNQFTIVFPKDKAPTGIFGKFESGPIKARLEAGGDVNIDYFPSVSAIMKMDNNGYLNVTGTMKVFDAKGVESTIPLLVPGINPVANPDMIFDFLTKEAFPNFQRQYQAKKTSPLNPNNFGGPIKSGDQAEQLINQATQQSEE